RRRRHADPALVPAVEGHTEFLGAPQTALRRAWSNQVMQHDSTPTGRSLMRKPSKRTAIIGAAVVAVSGGAVGGAIAASGPDPAAEQQAYLNDAAGRLGTSSGKLEAALKAAAIDRVDAALAAGRITKDEAQAMKDAINSGRVPLGPGFGFHVEGHAG